MEKVYNTNRYGICLIRRVDNISNMLLELSNMKYTDIGFQFGDNKILIYPIINIDKKKGIWNIKKYLKENYVSYMKYKPLLSGYEKEYKNIINKYLENSINFNYNFILETIGYKYRSIYESNLIITEINNINKEEKNNEKEEENVNKWTTIIESEKFGDEIIVNIKVKRNESIIIKHNDQLKKIYIMKCKKFLGYLINPKLRSLIINEIKNIIKNYDNIEIIDKCKIFIESSYNLINEYNKTLINKKTLDGLYNIYNETKNNLYDLIQNNIEISKNIELNKNNIKILRITNKEEDEKIIDIKSKILDINNELEKENPIVDINILLELFQTMFEIITNEKLELKKCKHTSKRGILKSDDYSEQTIPIMLNNGEQIIIPLKNPKLSKYSESEIDEIIIVLDILSNGDNRFDNIRAEATLIKSKMMK